MLRSPRFIRPVLRASGLLAAAAAALLATAGGASAAPASGPIVPQTFGPANSPAHTRTVQWPVVCDFSNYGGSASTQYDYTLSLPRTATAGTPVTATLASPVIALPSAVATKLAGVDRFALSTPGKLGSYVSDGLIAALGYAGSASSPSSTPAEIPAIKAAGAVTFGKAGTGSITNATGFVITPSAAGKAMPTIRCTSPVATLTGYSVTVSAAPAPPVPPAASGPVYNCQILLNGKSAGSVPGTPLPMTLTATGPRTTGSTDRVTLTSGAAGLGAPYPSGTVAVEFTGALAVTGAQHGAVLLSRETTELSSSKFSVSGSLYLTQPGTDRILFPGTFVFTVIGPRNPATGMPITLALACKATANVIGLRLNVTGQPVTAPAPQGSATPTPGAAPAGAPNTGGGHPASDLPLAAGGAALLLAGAAGVGFAFWRRRQGQPSV